MEKRIPKIFNLFVKVGHFEGLSYLMLLLIAMPLKYWFGAPLAVKLVGSIHGFLFVLYCILLAITAYKMHWSFVKAGLAFLLSLLPFGTFWLHKFK